MQDTNDLLLKKYYNQRSSIYEQVYAKAERQMDLELLRTELKDRFFNKSVLEVACGTGYWTQIISETAMSLYSTDQSLETLEIAKSKTYPKQNVIFNQIDAYHLSTQIPNVSKSHNQDFSAGFAGFWWSHIPKLKIQKFLYEFHSQLKSDAHVIIIDNQYVEGSNYPITESDLDGNTYQHRPLPDGSVHKVLKNFPTDQELLQSISPYSDKIEIKRFDYYWLMAYTLNKR